MKEGGLKESEGLSGFHSEVSIFVLGVSNLVGVNVNGGEMLQHLSKGDKTDWRVLIEAREEVSLGVAERSAEDVFYFILFGREIVSVSSQLSLYLYLLALKGRVHPIGED